MRTFDGRIAAIRDASLFDIEFDLGFDVKVVYTTRLIDPSTGEPLLTRDKAYGQTSAKQFVREWVMRYPTVAIDISDRHNGLAYGYVRAGDEVLNETLIAEGYQLSEASKREAKVSLYQPEDIIVPKLIEVDYESMTTEERFKARHYPLS